jgi:hypothetical protein
MINVGCQSGMMKVTHSLGLELLVLLLGGLDLLLLLVLEGSQELGEETRALGALLSSGLSLS